MTSSTALKKKLIESDKSQKNEDITTQRKLTLLILDDEQDIISSLTRLLRKDYHLVSFTDGFQGLEYLQNNHVDMLMSDMRMPNIDGAEFLRQAKEISPTSVRLLLTGYSDIESTVKAVNEGGIYAYLSKPWDNDELKLILAKAAEYYLLTQEKIELSKRLEEANNELVLLNESLEVKVVKRTEALQLSKQKLITNLAAQKHLLHDILDMMSATIEYRTGFSSSHIKRIATFCRALALILNFDEAASQKIYLCALLHEIGAVGLSDELLTNKDINCTHLDESMHTHPVIGAEIVGRIKRFSTLTANIRHQNENVDGTGLPDHLNQNNIPMGARIIRVVKDFDYIVAGKSNKKRMSLDNAEIWMLERAGIWYDSKVLHEFLMLIKKHDNSHGLETGYFSGIERLKPGDMLLEDLVLQNGNIMLRAGQEISENMLEKLRQYEEEYNTKVTIFTS